MSLVSKDDIQQCAESEDENLDKILEVESQLTTLKEQW